jgi:hypothetical protein
MTNTTTSTKQRSYFTGTWYSNTPNYYQALFLCHNLKEAKKAAEIYKMRNNLKGATIVTKNFK